MLRTSLLEKRAGYPIIWLLGTLGIWQMLRAVVPPEITGDFRIMGLVLLALITVSLINWIGKLNIAASS